MHLGFGHPSLLCLFPPFFLWDHVLTRYWTNTLANCIPIKKCRGETEGLVTEQKAIEQAIGQKATWQLGSTRDCLRPGKDI